MCSIILENVVARETAIQIKECKVVLERLNVKDLTDEKKEKGERPKLVPFLNRWTHHYRWIGCRVLPTNRSHIQSSWKNWWKSQGTQKSKWYFIVTIFKNHIFLSNLNKTEQPTTKQMHSFEIPRIQLKDASQRVLSAPKKEVSSCRDQIHAELKKKIPVAH